MSGGPSQPKVVDEVWSDERVCSFLALKPHDGSNADFHALKMAYEHMVADDFRRFLGFFKAAGRDLGARGPDGESLLQRIREHGRSQAYVAALHEAGALE